MENLPWWSLVGLVLLLVHHPDLGGVDHGFDFRVPSEEDVNDHVQVARQLQVVQRLDAEPSEDGHKGLHIKIPDFNISVPCYNIPLVGYLAKPCGNVTIGEAGRDIKTPFGTKHIPGTDTIKPYVKTFEKSFEHYTGVFVASCAALYGIIMMAVPSFRAETIEKIKHRMAGQLDEEEDDEKDDDRLDPKSENFIAPGNIYRLLAVLHPGRVGYAKWIAWAFKAFVCAYMQLYLPSKIIKTVLGEWSYHGIKSPLWFISQGGTFLTMFISVGSLCNLFASKCTLNIKAGAEANFHILTHNRPSEDYQPLPQKEGAPPKHFPKLPPSVITANKYFWCCMSFACNIGMSFLLFFAMFLKIATFTDNISQVATVAVALYFIFDLDDKVLAADPKLRPKYRAAVISLTEEQEYKPTWFLVGAAVMKAVLSTLTPIGLGMILLVAWKSDKMAIGGDPF